MTNKAPEWVTNLAEDDENKELLSQVVEAGVQPLETPREFTFGIKNFTDENTTRSAAQEVIGISFLR